MDVVDARVRKCKDISIIYDKKLRERKIEYEKYIIHLGSNNPFEVNEFVKVIRKEDFEKLGSILKTLKHERSGLKNQIKELQIKLEMQGKYIEKLESGRDKSENRGFLKSLIN